MFELLQYIQLELEGKRGVDPVSFDREVLYQRRLETYQSVQHLVVLEHESQGARQQIMPEMYGKILSSSDHSSLGRVHM